MPPFYASPDDHCLMSGSTPERLADVLGVSVRQARRYKTESITLPEPCRRLLRLHRDGDVAAIWGKHWEGFFMKPDGLHLPSYDGKRGFTPGELNGMFFTFQLVSALKRQIRDLEAQVWAAEKVRTTERSGSLHAKMQQYAQRLEALSAALADDLTCDSATAATYRRVTAPEV